MNIGDKVRLLRGTEEGVIVRILKDNLVEIEIEDGFSFPVLRSEVVVVHKSEADHFKKEPAIGAANQKTPAKPPIAQAEKGIYLGFETEGDLYSILLANNTDYDLAFKFDELLKGSIYGFRAGHIPAKSVQQIGSKSIATFENWPDLQFTCLYFQQGVYKTLPLLSRKLSFQPGSFVGKKGDIPLTSKTGYVYQLDETTPLPSAREIKERMYAPKDKPESASKDRIPRQNASAEVDLHLEKLVDKASAIPSTQALSYQVAIFEKELDKAIAEGLDEITFIHGVGNGVLKEEIHKRLSKMKNILYFQDARKERFGYGATLVKLKE